MNILDWIIGICLLIAFIKGCHDGFIRQFVILAVIILSAMWGGKLADAILPWVTKTFHLSENPAHTVSYIIAFVIIAILLSILGNLINKFIRAIHLNFFNRLFGGITGTGIMIFILSLILNMIVVLDKQERIITPEIKSKSFFFEKTEKIAPNVVPYIKKDFLERYIPKDYCMKKEKEIKQNARSERFETSL